MKEIDTILPKIKTDSIEQMTSILGKRKHKPQKLNNEVTQTSEIHKKTNKKS